jgi:trehalose 6-phosphate synthase
VPATDHPPLVVVSNRGPLAFRIDEDGNPVPTRAGGGLVACLAPALTPERNALWITSAVTEADRKAADGGPVEVDGIRVHHVAIELEHYRQYYDVIANGTLWFLHHNLFDLARRPRIDQHWWAAWHTFCDVNDAFSELVASQAPEGAIVLVHDYHLGLMGSTLRELRPDLRTVYFHHTPFTGRNTIGTLPQTAVRRLIDGMNGFDACGFHAQEWADNFALCSADAVGRVPATFISAAAPDVHELQAVAHTHDTQVAFEHLESLAAGRKLIVRVDRMELSKNLLRGFLAYDDLLQRYPRWRENVTFVANLYPSREGLIDYLAYRNEVEGLIDQINERWGTPDWMPIVVSVQDDFPRSVAALRRYDVLLVNPIRDGLNLVAKEGAILNECDGAVVLSREAGSWVELQEFAIGINPFDITATSDALLHALEMSNEEKQARARGLFMAASARHPSDWLNDQIRSVWNP